MRNPGGHGEAASGVNLTSLTVTLRAEARLPIGIIQRYLSTVHGLHLSVEAIVAAVHRTAQKVQSAVADILAQIRPVDGPRR